jgi:hypothetical protein
MSITHPEKLKKRETETLKKRIRPKQAITGIKPN